MADDAIRDATGMHARNAPLSEAVVLDIPAVSNIKYITGSRSAIKSSALYFSFKIYFHNACSCARAQHDKSYDESPSEKRRHTCAVCSVLREDIAQSVQELAHESAQAACKYVILLFFSYYISY